MRIATKHYLDRVAILLMVERLAFDALYSRNFSLYHHLMESREQRCIALRG